MPRPSSTSVSDTKTAKAFPRMRSKPCGGFALPRNRGTPPAQYNLSLKYAFGSGVPEDDVLAYMWANLAAAQSSLSLYRDWRDDIASELTRGQVAEAQRLSREWEPGNFTPADDATSAGSIEVTGTAFIVGPGGFLLTAHHVIDQATTILVSCSAGPPSQAHS